MRVKLVTTISSQVISSMHKVVLSKGRVDTPQPRRCSGRYDYLFRKVLSVKASSHMGSQHRISFHGTYFGLIETGPLLAAH